MTERRLVGRRYTDLHPESNIPAYPIELERRRRKRREADRDEGLESVTATQSLRHPRVVLLYTAVWHCNHCGREGRRLFNLSKEGRQYITADLALGSISLPPCTCGHSDWNLNWVLQAGRE
jgi:hypothetical protein